MICYYNSYYNRMTANFLSSVLLLVQHVCQLSCMIKNNTSIQSNHRAANNKPLSTQKNDDNMMHKPISELHIDNYKCIIFIHHKNYKSCVCILCRERIHTIKQANVARFIFRALVYHHHFGFLKDVSMQGNIFQSQIYFQIIQKTKNYFFSYQLIYFI